MTLYDDACRFVKSTLVFDDAQSWQVMVRRFDDYDELRPMYAASRPQTFIDDLVLQCLNKQFQSKVFAFEALISFLKTRIGVDRQAEADILVQRWRTEPREPPMNARRIHAMLMSNNTNPQGPELLAHYLHTLDEAVLRRLQIDWLDVENKVGEFRSTYEANRRYTESTDRGAKRRELMDTFLLVCNRLINNGF